MASQILISSGIISFLVQAVFAATGPDVAQKLNLGKTEIAGTTVHYEKCFEPNLPFFEKTYRAFLKATESEKTKPLQNKDQIIAEINRILGIDDPNVQTQRQMLDDLTRPLPFPKPTFFLVTLATVKDFLRAGGKLPNFTYDKATDTARYHLQVCWAPKTSDQQTLQFALPLKSEAEFEQVVSLLFGKLAEIVAVSPASTTRVGLAVHEVTEVGLVRRLKPQGPYWRWFSDGLANALAVELLKKHIGEPTAQEYADTLKTEEYKDIKDALNLRYWMMPRYCILPMGKPIEQEDRFTMARYAYSMSEVRRLIKEHGHDWITQLCNELSQMQKRTSKELFETIEKLTGEDMAKRLERYQSFETRKEGQRKYFGQFNETAEKRDYNQMLFNLFRIMELEEFQPSPDNLKRWPNAAGLLFEMGYQEVADEVMDRYVELFSNSPVPHGREAALELFLIYSLNCNRPEKALSEAAELLEIHPDSILALAVQMLSKANSDQLAEAKEIAQRICALVKNENSASYKAAQRVLAMEPNEPKQEED